MILHFGDSLAWGTPLAQAITGERVVQRSQPGIATEPGVDAFLHPIGGARVIVVSLGTNDWRNHPAAYPQIGRVKRAARTSGSCLLWVTLRTYRWRASETAFNDELRRREVKTVPYAAAVDRGELRLVDTVHPDPAGYTLRARLIRRAVAEKC